MELWILVPRRLLLFPEFNIKQLAAIIALLLLAAISHAQVTPQADLSFEYSHLFIATSSNINMDGGSFSGAYNINEWVGLVGDLGVYQGSQAGAGLTAITYMFGMRISYRRPERVVPLHPGSGRRISLLEQPRRSLRPGEPILVCIRWRS